MDKCKLVVHDTSMETNVECSDETVENVEEVESEIVKPSEHQSGTNLCKV